MYKLIIGNVKVTVEDDSFDRQEAAALARRTVAEAARRGKLLSHIGISAGEEGPKIEISERAVSATTRKTIRQSMLDAVCAAAREKLFPTHIYAAQDTWLDVDTGQEWYGEIVNETRDEIMAKLDAWLKTL
jgi:hypothetical protein